MGLLRCLSLESELKIITSLCIVCSLFNISASILSNFEVIIFNAGFEVEIIVTGGLLLSTYFPLFYGLIKKKAGMMRSAYYGVPFQSR